VSGSASGSGSLVIEVVAGSGNGGNAGGALSVAQFSNRLASADSVIR
jgi:hypothetical protein